MNRFATNLFGEEGLYLQAQFAAVAGFVGCVALSTVGVEVWDWGEWSILLVVPAIIWFILMIRSKSHQINREYMSTLALDYGYAHGERRWKVEVAGKRRSRAPRDNSYRRPGMETRSAEEVSHQAV